MMAEIGPWAATLDELVAELDVVIIVSAGNRDGIRIGNRIEQAVTEYPGYLMELQTGWSSRLGH